MVAGPVETDLLLKALVRAAFASKRPTLVSAGEARRWQTVDPLDSAAMVAAAFVRVEVDAVGDWRPVWRHETATVTTSAEWTAAPPL